jgi:hypothetical protein
VYCGRGRQEHEWPLARTRFTDFYLHADGPAQPMTFNHLRVRPSM